MPSRVLISHPFVLGPSGNETDISLVLDYLQRMTKVEQELTGFELPGGLMRNHHSASKSSLFALRGPILIQFQTEFPELYIYSKCYRSIALINI
jgi:hypothetical protein